MRMRLQDMLDAGVTKHKTKSKGAMNSCQQDLDEVRENLLTGPRRLTQELDEAVDDQSTQLSSPSEQGDGMHVEKPKGVKKRKKRNCIYCSTTVKLPNGKLRQVSRFEGEIPKKSAVVCSCCKVSLCYAFVPPGTGKFSKMTCFQRWHTVRVLPGEPIIPQHLQNSAEEEMEPIRPNVGNAATIEERQESIAMSSSDSGNHALNSSHKEQMAPNDTVEIESPHVREIVETKEADREKITDSVLEREAVAGTKRSVEEDMNVSNKKPKKGKQRTKKTPTTTQRRRMPARKAAIKQRRDEALI